LKPSGKSIDISIPSVQVKLSKQSLDALQLFADDLAQWSQFLQQQGNGAESRRFQSPENKMIGSRFFGAKTYTRSHGVGIGSESSESSGGEGTSTVKISLAITDGKY
jgi:autophagy-related protein 2